MTASMACGTGNRLDLIVPLMRSDMQTWQARHRLVVCWPSLATTRIASLRLYQATVPEFCGICKFRFWDPTDIGDLIEYGLYGWALSRFTGLWVSVLAQTSVMDSSATIQLPTKREPFVFPRLDFDPHIRLVDTPHEQERRMVDKLNLVKEFVAANPINHVVTDTAKPKLAIVTTGKSYTNVRQSLRLLGLRSELDLSRVGIRIIKLGLIWPTNRTWLRERVEDARAVLVVEIQERVLGNRIEICALRQSTRTHSRQGRI